MKILLDTATFLWICSDAEELSDSARSQCADPGNEIYLSSVSVWEISVKNSLGRLPLPGPVADVIPALRTSHAIESLPLTEEATLQIGRLPSLHRDPFDRMLVCQAIAHGMALLTPDETIRRYPIRTLW